MRQPAPTSSPDRPTIPYIVGDGIGPDIWRATRLLLDAAVESAYGSARAINWFEVMAGERAQALTGKRLPAETLLALTRHKVGIKGPLATEVARGERSPNVALRQALDLYACVRPVRHIPGAPTPLREPSRLDVVIFRENTEDVYVGIEWPAESPGAEQLRTLLAAQFGATIRPASALGLKPISEFASKRLVRAAIAYALATGRPSVTLVHKGNIMKHTEGAFCEWGYEVARDGFGTEVVAERDGGSGRVVIKDRIADAMFQELLLRPEEHSVIATTNLNGDYLSDAAAAQVGGLGLAPGGNLGDEVAVFEATHGTAPDIAGRDIANPCSLMLSGAMLLEHLGWGEAAALVRRAIEVTIGCGVVTADLARQVPGVTAVSSSQFAAACVRALPGMGPASASLV